MHARSKVFLFSILIFLTTAIGFSQAVRSEARFEQPTLLTPLDLTFQDILARRDANPGPVGRIRPLVAWGDTEPIFIFPLVGSTAGSGGTFFHTESVISNDTTHPQDIILFWFPIGGGAANCTRPATRFHMNTNTWYFWDDLAAQLLGASGLGAVVVVGVDSAGNLDPTAHIDGFSKIWTFIPGSSGTVAQSFVAESLNANASAQWAYGLRQDSGFRTNIGIFNYDTVARTFAVQIIGSSASTTTSASIDACTVSLFAAPAGSWGRILLYVTANDSRGLWYSFGSSLDNVSGASWSSVTHPY